jgi:hypothetical protein
MPNIKLNEALQHEGETCDILRRLYANSAFASHLLAAAVEDKKIRPKGPLVPTDLLNTSIGIQKGNTIALHKYVQRTLHAFRHFEDNMEKYGLFAIMVMANPNLMDLFEQEVGEESDVVGDTLEDLTNLIARDSLRKLNESITKDLEK